MGGFRGFIRNVEVFERYVDFAGIAFRNRQEPLVADWRQEPESLERVQEYATA
jgi:hypothetical protein